MKPKLNDDFALLKNMIKDSKGQPFFYKPGSYWLIKVKNTENEIYRCGIKKFRCFSNLIGFSYADNMYIDVRDAYNNGLRKILRLITRCYPIKLLFNNQIKLTKSYADKTIQLLEELLNLKPRTKQLLNKYTVPYSLLGECINKIKIDDSEYAIHYLNLLEQHDNLTSYIDFTAIRSVFEIGGGFGVNIHILLENYPKIKKVLYLDIPPNLYVGTQYLKAFYGNAVYDYNMLKEKGEITFSDNNNLEIFCIAPWQIENFKSEIDIFINAHSFVEMPREVVENYAIHFRRLAGIHNSAIALISYDNFDLNYTLDPKDLLAFFPGRQFDCFSSRSLIDDRVNTYHLFTGDFSKTNY